MAELLGCKLCIQLFEGNRPLNLRQFFLAIYQNHSGSLPFFLADTSHWPAILELISGKEGRGDILVSGVATGDGVALQLTSTK